MKLAGSEREVDDVDYCGNVYRCALFQKPGWDGIWIRLPVWAVGQDLVNFWLGSRSENWKSVGVAGGQGECGDDVAGLLVRERSSLDILPVKKEAKLSASEVPRELVGSGEENLWWSSLLTVCQKAFGVVGGWENKIGVLFFGIQDELAVLVPERLDSATDLKSVAQWVHFERFLAYWGWIKKHGGREWTTGLMETDAWRVWWQWEHVYRTEKTKWTVSSQETYKYYGRICYEFRGFRVGQKRIDPTSTEWSQQEEKSMWHGKEILLKVVNDHLRCSQRI